MENIKLVPVVLESPYSEANGRTIEQNERYGLQCLHDCLKRGEAPIASHLLLTRFLRDHDPEERTLGIAAGHAWTPLADKVVVYIDHGISSGMKEGIEVAKREGVEVEFRKLSGDVVNTVPL